MAICIVIILTPITLTATGCSNKTDETKVTGIVRYKGEPLPGGTLTFFGDADGKNQARTLIGPGGTFQLLNPPRGSVKITVEGPSPPSGVEGAKPAVVIPVKYANPGTSGLTYTVVMGGGTQTHNIELE